MPSGPVEQSSGRRACWLIALLACSPACHQTAADDDAAHSAERTFATICARCHGLDGKGGVGPEGTNAPRNFVDAAFQASRSDEQLKDVIRKGKGPMPPFGNLFSDPVLAALVHKVRSFNPGAKR
jgi:mono/diheme cytochrome c family protein